MNPWHKKVVELMRLIDEAGFALTDLDTSGFHVGEDGKGCGTIQIKMVPAERMKSFSC